MKYEIKKYYSTFVTFQVEANSEEEAFNKSEELNSDLIEIQNNLLEWKDADEIINLEENH